MTTMADRNLKNLKNLNLTSPLINTEKAKPQALRAYQESAVQAVLEAWGKRVPDKHAGRTRPVRALVSMATGGGKTTVFAEIIRRVMTDPEHQRALLFCDTEEIIQQMYDRVQMQFAELQAYYKAIFAPGIGIVMGQRDLPHARIVVATRQSLHPKRLAEVLKHGAFDFIIVDEAHGVSPDNTAHRVIQTCELANPEVKIAGFTATPKRADRKALGVVFDEIVYSWSIRDGVEGGYLAPATRLQVGTDVDLSAVKTEFGDFGGDYNQTELSEVLTAHEWVDLAVTAYQAHLQGKRKATLAYFPFVDMSKAFTAKLKSLGIRAEHVDGGTDKRERRKILRDYGAGNLEVVSNVMVLSKGFDAPRTDSILMARPTRSETLFTQIVGRGLRRAEEKIDCLLVELGVHDVKALEVGHLLGRLRKCKSCQYEFFFGLTACPNCAALVEEVLEDEEEEEEKEPGNKLPRTFRALSQSKIGELFEKLKSAWYRGEDGWITCEVGINAGAMVIMPPTGADISRQRERQLAGYDLLNQIDFEWREELRRQIDILEREIARAEHWTLYFVPPSLARSDDSWGKRQPEPIFLDSGDLDEVLKAGEREAVKRGGASDVRNTALKTAEWRARMASGAQLDYLHRLGAKLDKAISAGEAAQRITYLLNKRRVERWIETDYLPERQS